MTLQNVAALGTVPASWERRHAERVCVALPVRAAGVYGRTCNVCSNGLYFETTDRFREGDKVELSVLLPRGTLAGTVWVICTGRVVRVDSRGSVNGVAVAVKSFRFEIKADDASAAAEFPLAPFRLS